MILVTWILADGTKGSKEFPDSQLEEVNERCFRKFGTEKIERQANGPIHAGQNEGEEGRAYREAVAGRRKAHKPRK